jgi:HlyD family secretion protein
MRKIFIGTILTVALAAGLSACAAPAQSAAQQTPTAIPAVTADGTVIAEGKVVPADSVNLSFERTGTVAEILVAEGDTVQVGQPIARLDTRDLSLQVEQAQVSLDQAKADYAKLLEAATPEQVAAAQAEIARAQGSLQSTQASVTQSDITAARAQLESAKAALAQLVAGAKSTDIQSAQAAVDQARAGLESQRSALSQTKLNAELAVTKAANALRNAQDEYSRTYWDNRELEKLPGNLPQARQDAEAAARRAVENGEKDLAQAQMAIEQARQAEAAGVQSASAQLRDAEARMAKLLAPADADRLAAARADVATAQAHLAQLTGAERQGNVTSAQASVSAAEAHLAEIQAKPTDATLAAAAARVKGAEVSLEQARLAVEKTTLSAPIAGTIVEINLKVGEIPATTTTAVVLADLSNWKIETADLTELSVVRIHKGDAATITFDAIPGFEIPGKVTEIMLLGKNRQGDIVYTVVIKPTSWDERLRWNMTASVTIGS